MFNSHQYDFVVIGAGIVGLTVAKELTERFPKAKIAILEKESQIGMHASGRNSGVLHSGIYYPESTLKAKVCSQGAKRMMSFAREHRIACKFIGKVIIARTEKDIPVIEYLLQNAKNNDVEAHRLNETEIKKIEPYATPFQYGIYSPHTACIDSKAILNKLQEILLSKKVNFYFKHPVLNVLTNNNLIITTQKKFHFDYLFNCAGTGTDRIAKMCGLAKHFRLLPFKGIYYKLNKEKNFLVNGNIYPVPDLKYPFLGVHFTRTINGEIYVGPTAIPALGRENYGLLKGLSKEALRIVKDLFFMYLKNEQHFRHLIHAEIKKYLKHYFCLEARTLVSSIGPKDLLPSSKVGIRAQLINLKKSKLEMDYIIEQNSNSMHVLNAISPAFTGAFRFAELLVDQMNKC